MRSPKFTWVWAALLLPSIVITPVPASAMPDFLEEFKAEYPWVAETKLDTCNVCHITFPRRNPYGIDYNLAGRRFAAIEPIDSDGDGVANLTEIEALTFPGDASDHPGAPATPTVTPIATRTPGASCEGDCNGDGFVKINEVILAVNIGLDLATVGQCPAADGNGNGQVTIDEVVTGVNLGLSECP